MTPLQSPRDFALCEDQIFPALRALIRSGYFSLTVHGIEHVPRSGPVVYVANHAGWVTVDSLIAGMAIYDHLGPERLPYTVAQDVLFRIPGVGRFLRDVGAVPASLLHRLLQPGGHDGPQVFAVFPEGAEAACKPFWRAYRMLEWRTGFVRLALARRAQVVPVAILGGEECMPSAARLGFLKPLLGTAAPLPLTMLPLPTAWRILFHPPVDLTAHPPEAANDYALCKQLAAEVRWVVQSTIERESAGRPLARLSALLGSRKLRA